MKAKIRTLINEAKSRPARDRRKKPYSWVNEGELSDRCKEALQACRDLQEPSYTVYFIECGGFIKIGVTQLAAISRMREFMTGSPHEYTLIAEVAGSVRLERALHKLFRDYRHRGEWFRIEGELKRFVDAIQAARPEFWPSLAENQRKRLEDEHRNLSPLTDFLKGAA